MKTMMMLPTIKMMLWDLSSVPLYSEDTLHPCPALWWPQEPGEGGGALREEIEQDYIRLEVRLEMVIGHRGKGQIKKLQSGNHHPIGSRTILLAPYNMCMAHHTGPLLPKGSHKGKIPHTGDKASLDRCR